MVKLKGADKENNFGLELDEWVFVTILSHFKATLSNVCSTRAKVTSGENYEKMVIYIAAVAQD